VSNIASRTADYACATCSSCTCTLSPGVPQAVSPIPWSGHAAATFQDANNHILTFCKAKVNRCSAGQFSPNAFNVTEDYRCSDRKSVV
jgi:hypothetical protein